MLKRFISIAVGGSLLIGLLGFLGCQSDEGVTGVTATDEDRPPGIEGTVYDPSGIPKGGVYVSAICYTCNPPQQVGGTYYTGNDGWYECLGSGFQYHQYHWFRLRYSFWDGGGWVMGYTDLFQYVPPVTTYDICL